MSAEEKPNSGGSLPTMVATAAVTLAIGVTVAALGGYLKPADGAATDGAAVAAGEATVAPPRPDPAPTPDAPAVVLVPIAPQASADPTLAPSPGADEQLAVYEPSAYDDEGYGYDEEDDEGHERDHESHERDHDDDD